MILTGKAKEDFFKDKTIHLFKDEYNELTEYYFNKLTPFVQSQLIIEFFDSVGITVDVIPRIYDENEIVFEPNTFSAKYNITTIDDFDGLKTRQEATRQAIIKANEIYNSKN